MGTGRRERGRDERKEKRREGGKGGEGREEEGAKGREQGNKIQKIRRRGEVEVPVGGWEVVQQMAARSHRRTRKDVFFEYAVFWYSDKL